MRGSLTLGAAAAGAALAAGIAVVALPGGGDDRGDRGGEKRALGLLTSLPIHWEESTSISEALESDEAPHWARAALEAEYDLIPVDALEGRALDRLDRLILAQPRPLAPAENVALDDWVRAGGRVLVFADPHLTEHSRFVLGDRRRPQDLAMLSPILRRWGLELTVDPDQPADEREVAFRGRAFPIRLAGTWRLVTPGAPSRCELESESRVASCRIGEGRALLVADAALLERERAPSRAREGLRALSEAAFDQAREN